MNSYTISYDNPHTRLIDIKIHFPSLNGTNTQFKLPKWRPGRYELGNFAGHIYNVQALSSDGTLYKLPKISTNCWKLNHKDGEPVTLVYQYYANQHDGGGTFLSKNKLYINPINCLLYTDNSRIEPCLLHIDIPDTYKIAISLPKKNNGFFASSFDELVDSPFVASPSLTCLTYMIRQKPFYIWIDGAHNLDLDKLRDDFIAFTESQVAILPWQELDAFHFIIQILPFKAYHGVEHKHCTIIILGPDAGSTNDHFYEQLMGVSSHELFHYWNVKRLKPQAFTPYDYDTENYYDTGYVVEGFTMYYGDLALKRGGVFDEDWYIKELNRIIKRHYDNFGRLHFSLRESSQDLWVDGYKNVAPNRKVSIYIEGCLIALVLDLKIRSMTNHNHSLDDVLSLLWHNGTIRDQGYTHQDIISAVNQIVQADLSPFIDQLVNDPLDISATLSPLLNEMGYQLILQKSDNPLEDKYGMRAQIIDDKLKIINIEPDSPGYYHLSIGDEIKAINGNNASHWADYELPDQITLDVISDGLSRQATLDSPGKHFFQYEMIVPNDKVESLEFTRRQKWLNLQISD